MLEASFLIRRLPPVAQQLPLNTSPVTANIAQPLNGASLPSNDYTSVQASALGGVPLAALQLWVDGVPVAAQAAAGADARQVSGLFAWLPAGPGDHVLLVRAVDKQGHSNNSNRVRVRVAAPEPMTEKGSYLAKDGDTVETVAKQAGASPEIVLALNPGLDPNAILSAGQPITVPVVIPPDPGPDAELTAAPDAADDDTTEPADTDTGAQALPPVVTPTPPPDGADGAGIDPLSPPPDPLPLWLLLNFDNFFPPQLLPAAQPLTAPEMAASLNGCQAQIFIFDHVAAEMGYFVYRLAPNATSFERVGVIGAIQGAAPVAYTEPALYGLSLTPVPPTKTFTPVPPTITRTPIPPSPTFTPTPAPAPFLNFGADSTNLTGGQCTNIFWDSGNIQAIFLDGEGVGGNGARQVCPAGTTTYTLVANYAGGQLTRQVTVNVSAPPQPVIGSVGRSANEFNDANGCGPLEVSFTAAVTGATSATLFFRVLPSGDPATSWSSLPMFSLPGNQWGRTLHNTEMPAATGGVEYYVTAANTTSTVQSATFSGLQYLSCKP